LLRLNPALMHRFQHFILFVVFWEKFSGSLSLTGGILLFLLLGVFELLSEVAFQRKFPRIPGVLIPLLGSLPFILLIPLVHLLGPVAQLFNFSGELFLLNLYNYILPVIPCLILFRLLAVVSEKGKFLNLTVLTLYAIILTFLMSRSGWMMILPFGSLAFAYATLYLFILNESFLVLSSGEKGRILGLAHLFLLLLLPLLILIPVNRNYSSESKKESGGLLESSLFRFDFSDYLSLESSISMKDDLVFMMKKDGNQNDFMVRRFILPEYTRDKGFFRVPGPTLEAPGSAVGEYLLGEEFHEWNHPDFLLTESVPQEFFLVNFDSSAFLGMNSPSSVTPYQSWDHSSFSRIYRVDSMVSSAWGQDLMDVKALFAGDEISRKFMNYYTFYGDQQDLKDMAESITQGVGGYYNRVKTIESYLKQNYYYSLNPGSADDGDQLRHFLYDSRKGYCSYFAFSMTLLCRSLEIPARVALGFWVDGSSGVLNYYPVKANQAHAWVEVYFPDYGWIEFDPTSQTPAPGEEYLFSPLSAQEIEPYLKEILENRDSLEVMQSSDASEAKVDSRGKWKFFPKISVLFVFRGLFILLMTALSFRIIKTILFLYRVPPSKRSCSRYFRFHLILAESLIQSREKRESVLDYARKVSPSYPELEDFVVLYEKIRFGWSSLLEKKYLFLTGKELRSHIWKTLSFSGRMKYWSLLIVRGV